MIPDLDRNHRAEIVMLILAGCLGLIAIVALMFAFVRMAHG